VQDESRNPDADAREDPTSGTLEKGNTLGSRGLKRGRPEPDKTNSERWSEKSTREEERVQDEPRKPDAYAQADLIKRIPEEINPLAENLDLANIIRQNPVTLNTLPYDQFTVLRGQTSQKKEDVRDRRRPQRLLALIDARLRLCFTTIRIVAVNRSVDSETLCTVGSISAPLRHSSA